jgi:hypothetical protein
VACQGIPPAHAATIAQANRIKKQIVIDKDPDLNMNSLENLTEKEVVSKANLALSLMGICAEDVPEGITFVGAQKLQNGGVILQLNMAQAASWI